MEPYNQILILLFSPLFTISMFQLSSLLNQSFLRTGMIMLELEDIEKLTGISHKRIRMISETDSKTIFKIFDETNKNEIAKIVFNTESLQIISKENIEIENDKFFELRKNKFAQLIGVKEKNISISDNGSTFTEYNILDSGEKIPLGSVTFTEENEPTNITGTFKKLF